jgi:hypothetical protein
MANGPLYLSPKTNHALTRMTEGAIVETHRQIRIKGNDRNVMVSVFLCECHGLLKLNEQLQKEYPIERIMTDTTIVANEDTSLIRL